MSRAEKIMKKYGGAFGRIKALLFFLCGVAIIAMPIQVFVGNIAFAYFAAISIGVIVFGVFIFLQTMMKAKQNGPVSAVRLLFDMLYVGLDTDLIICKPFIRFSLWLLSVCTGGIIGGTKHTNGKFAQRYIRDSDGEYFYLYSDCGDYAYLASESANATTIEVWPRNNGYVHDNSGRAYRPL